MLVVLGAGLIGACGAPAVTNPEDEALVVGQVYKTMPGSTAKIFSDAKSALDGLGFRIVSVRENAAINARLDSPKKPIHVYVKIVAGNRVYISIYNVTGDEHDEWLTRLFTSIEASIRGTKAEQERPARG